MNRQINLNQKEGGGGAQILKNAGPLVTTPAATFGFKISSQSNDTKNAEPYQSSQKIAHAKWVYVTSSSSTLTEREFAF